MANQGLMLTEPFICIPSIRPQLANEAAAALHPLPVVQINGEGYTFSRLINHCIQEAHTAGKEILVVVSDRFRPTPAQIAGMLEKIKQGYGIVAAGCFGCFALKLDFVRLVGWFDERYGNGQEDTDMMLRCLECDIALYEAREIQSVVVNSSWKKKDALHHYNAKWQKEGDRVTRLLPEEKYPYEIGGYRGADFLDASHSVTIFEELRRSEFRRPLWRSRARPRFSLRQLAAYFTHLALWQGRRWWNRALRWWYE